MAAQPEAPASTLRGGTSNEDEDREVFVFRREHLASFPDDGNRYELVDGMVLVSPSPTRLHQWVVRELFVRLHDHLADTEAEVFGQEVDNVYSDTTVLIPDVIVFAPGGPNPVTEDPDRLADLVIEVSSPSTRRRDLGLKRQVYEREGVAEYWFVDLDRERVHVHVLGDDGYEVTVVGRDEPAASTLLVGFATTLEELLP